MTLFNKDTNIHGYLEAIQKLVVSFEQVELVYYLILDSGFTRDQLLNAQEESQYENERMIEVIYEAFKKKKIKIPKKINNFDYNDIIVNLFKDVYKGKRGREYIIHNKGREKNNAAKILKQYKLKYPDSNTDQMTKSLKKYFEKCLSIKDKFYYENMSLSLIVNKFNEINTILHRKPEPESEPEQDIINKNVKIYSYDDLVDRSVRGDKFTDYKCIKVINGERFYTHVKDIKKYHLKIIK